MKRRHFLRLAAITAVTGAFGASPLSAAGLNAWSRFPIPSDGPANLATRLLSAHARPKTAIAVGHALLDGLSGRPTQDQVVDRLLGNLGLPAPDAADLAPEKLRARINEQTLDDFRAGRTTEVQGWILAETEAWLCGLAALRAG